MNKRWMLLFSAWLVAIGATLGALFLGEVMGMTPCVLCWYQRIAMFPLALILGLAAYAEDHRGAVYALPLTLTGLGISAYHSLLVLGVVPKTWVPCGPAASCADQPLVILDSLQIPWLSLLAFALIAGLLFSYLKKSTQ